VDARMFAGAAGVEYAERLYAAVEDWKSASPCPKGEGGGVDISPGGFDFGKARLQVSFLTHTGVVRGTQRR
jgi:hypothetical protein